MIKLILALFLASSTFALDTDIRPALQVIQYDTVIMKDGSSILVKINDILADGTIIVQMAGGGVRKLTSAEYKEILASQTAYQVVTRRCTWDLKHNDPDDVLLTIEWGKKWTGSDLEKRAKMATILRFNAEAAMEMWPENVEVKTRLSLYLLNDKNLK
jgi:hypothetical protein